jgi:hypothetical protein
MNASSPEGSGRQGRVVQTTHSIEMLEVGPGLLGAEDAADLCHEAWQLPGKLRPRNGHLRIVKSFSPIR